MSVAAAVILGLGTAATAYISGQKQEDILKEGQVEAREIRKEDIAEGRLARKRAEKLTREQMRQSQKQFEETVGMRKEELGVQRELSARQDFRNQASRLSQIMNKDKNLETLLINRLKGLRN